MSIKDIALRGWRGINNKDAANRVNTIPRKDAPLVDLVQAVNVDIDDTGMMSRRAGQTLLVAGAAHSLWAGDTACLYVQSGTMYSMEAGGNRAVAAGLADLPMSYVDLNGRVYHSNGKNAAVLDGGRVRSWGIKLSNIDLSAVAAANGQMDAGVYQCAMTLVRSDGQESGTALALRVDLNANGAIQFSWPVPRDLDLVGARLYVSQPDGEDLFLAADVNVEDGAYTYTGGVRSLPLWSQWLDAPPAASVLAMYRGRIYMAVQELVYATSPLSFEHCDLRDYRAIDGSEVRVLAPVDQGIFIGTANGVYFLSGTDFRTSNLTKKMDGGAVKGSLVQIDGMAATNNPQLAGIAACMFTTENGIVLGLPDGTLQNLTVDRYQMPPGALGAAVFRGGQTHQYLLAIRQ